MIGGGASGVDNLGYTFGRPCVTTNLVPLEIARFATSPSVVMPCLMRDEATGRVLPLSEMAKFRFSSKQDFRSAGIGLIYNSADEVLQATLETVNFSEVGMKEIVTGDNEMQRHFWEWARECGFLDRPVPTSAESSDRFRSAVSQNFLEAHKEILFR